MKRERQSPLKSQGIFHIIVYNTNLTCRFDRVYRSNVIKNVITLDLLKKDCVTQSMILRLKQMKLIENEFM